MNNQSNAWSSALFVSLTLFCLLTSPSVSADVIIDPAGDFLPSYTGPANGDLDVLEAEVLFDGASFLFTSTSAAPIGTTPTGIFVWGINRGAGFATFPVIAPGVTFDAVAVIVPGGASFIADLAAMTETPIPASDVTISGAFLSTRGPLSALPSLGAAPVDYTVNLWPRSELSFVDEVIADFAPDNSNAAVTFVPESGASMGMLGLALVALMMVRLRWQPS
jgi:hypothetical protein